MPRLNTQLSGSRDSRLSTDQQPEPESGMTQARRIKLVESEPRIEREHSDLLALEMELSAAVGAGASRAELFIRLTQLVGAFQSHFASEESLMRSNNFPGLQLHAKEHRKLIGQISGFRDDIGLGNTSRCDALALIVRLWTEQHRVGPDTDFSHFLYLKRKYVQKPAGIEPAGIENAIVLSVSTNDGDSVFWERLFHESGESVFTNSEWTLITRATLPSAFSALREMPIPIVLCDNDLQPGAWRESWSTSPSFRIPHSSS